MARLATHLLLVASLLWGPSAAVGPNELSDWIESSSGLAMNHSQAEDLAEKQWRTLTQCGVTLDALDGLRKVMVGKMGMSLAEVSTEIWIMAEQHVAPGKLSSFYDACSSGYTLHGGLALPKQEAQQQALAMAKAKAEPGQLYSLYRVMYGYFGLGFDKKRAQRVSIQLALAGADAEVFKSSYRHDHDLDQAVAKSIRSNLDDLVRRHARDAKPYNASQFMAYYKQEQWLSEWLDAPMELRLSQSRTALTAGEFESQFGSKWEDVYRAAEVATQMRLAKDKKQYNMTEFKTYYGDAWQKEWADAPELACAECAPFLDEPSLVVV